MKHMALSFVFVILLLCILIVIILKLELNLHAEPSRDVILSHYEIIDNYVHIKGQLGNSSKVISSVRIAQKNDAIYLVFSTELAKTTSHDSARLLGDFDFMIQINELQIIKRIVIQGISIFDRKIVDIS